VTLPQIGFLVATYFLGSIPTGYWLGKTWKGIDIRQHGSGNLGATNVLRVLGKGPALFTFTFDCLKGLIPVLICQHLFPDNLLMATLTGLAAILGHTMSVFVHFQGGKGMATSTGVFAALLPMPWLVAITVFLTATIFTRYVSLGSILGALTLTACSFIFSAPRPLAWTTVAVAAFVIWKHRANIQRLLQGTENRLAWGKKTS
jgi:acyl phosphate:glycerol-3-phosphate acyltransferase